MTATATNLADYAVANNSTPSQVTANTAGMATALALGFPLYIGDTFYIGSVALPAKATVYGKGKLIAAGTITASGVLTATDVSDVSIEDISIVADFTSYPTLVGVALLRSPDCRVERLKISASQGVIAGACNRLVVRGVRVTAYKIRGILLCKDGTTRGLDAWLENNWIEGADASSNEGIAVGDYDRPTITGNHLRGSRNFAISVQNCNDQIFHGNTSNDSYIEAFVATGLRGIMSGNIATLNTNHHDYGLSFYATLYPIDQYLVSGNLVSKPYKTGIAVGSGAQRMSISGNFVVDPGWGNEANQRDGIHLFGDGTAAPQYVYIHSNAIMDWVGLMQNPIREFGTPSPNNNMITDNLGHYNFTITGAGSKLFDNHKLF